MTDTLDFPAIDAAALTTEAAAPSAPKTEIAAAAAGALDLDKLDLSTLALSKFGAVRKQLADATKTLTGTVHDLSTQAKVDDAKSLRQRVINTPLADARKISKGLKSKLKSVSDDVGAELEKIEAGFIEAGKLITPQIEAREAELAAEKAKREAKEAARRQVFEEKVAQIRGYLALAQGLPSARVQKGVDYLANLVIGDEFEEFQPIAQKALEETLANLRELLAKTQAAEIEAAERERQRLEAEQRERDLAAERQRLADERAVLERERAELAAARAAAAPAAAPAPLPQTATTTTEGIAALMSGAAQGQQVAVSSETSAFDHVMPEGVNLSAAGAYSPGPRAEIDVAGEFAKAADDQRVTGTGWLRMSCEVLPDGATAPIITHVPLIDVVKADPPAPADRTGALPLLLAHIAEAFEGKFPSQPKPSIEWWAELKRLAAEVAA